MTAAYSLEGQRFGKLLVLKKTEQRKWSSVVWECQCDCGKVVGVTSNALKSAGVKSCGCLVSETAKISSKRHGDYNSPTHRSWTSMLTRCRNEKAREYRYYGALGVTVCERWLKYENFLADMGPRPEKTSIDRLDSSKGYYKENCRWATRCEQARNKRKPSTTFEVAEKIREMRLAGARPKEIQSHFGITYGALQSILYGKHITTER